MKKLSIAMIALLSLAACATSTKQETTATPAAPASETAAQTSATAVPAATTANDLQAQLDQLGKESVYFDFDKAIVKTEFRDQIKKQADFMLANKGDVVTLEGNCDERGSAEYNLALGSRRAYSVEKQLEIMGVPKAQIKTVSYGKEHPRLTCHEEKCWKENRRVDFVHKLN